MVLFAFIIGGGRRRDVLGGRAGYGVLDARYDNFYAGDGTLDCLGARELATGKKGTAQVASHV